MKILLTFLLCTIILYNVKFDGNEIKNLNEGKQEVKDAIKRIEKQMKKNYKKLKTMCVNNELYYDWKGRPKRVCIPVLDKDKFSIKKCKELL